MNKNHTAECARARVRVCMCIIIITESMNDTVYLLPIQSARPDDADIILVCIRHAHACAPHEMYTHTHTHQKTICNDAVRTAGLATTPRVLAASDYLDA